MVIPIVLDGFSSLITMVRNAAALGRQQERPFVPSTIQNSTILPGKETTASRPDFASSTYKSSGGLAVVGSNVTDPATTGFSRETYTSTPLDDARYGPGGRRTRWDPISKTWVYDEPNRLLGETTEGFVPTWYWGFIVPSGATFIEAPFYFESEFISADQAINASATVEWSGLEGQESSISTAVFKPSYLDQASVFSFIEETGPDYISSYSVVSSTVEPVVLSDASFTAELDLYFPPFAPVTWNNDADRLQHLSSFGVNIIGTTSEGSPNPINLSLDFRQNEAIPTSEELEGLTELKAEVVISCGPLLDFTITESQYLNEVGIWFRAVSIPLVELNKIHRVCLSYTGASFTLAIDGTIVATITAPRVILLDNQLSPIPLADKPCDIVVSAASGITTEPDRPTPEGGFTPYMAIGDMVLAFGDSKTTSYTPTRLNPDYAGVLSSGEEVPSGPGDLEPEPPPT